MTEPACGDAAAGGCSGGPDGCVFAKALLARHAQCGLAQRHELGEMAVLRCASPVARINCSTLSALLRERAAFALRLPRNGPLEHAKTMRLQCGGLAGLGQALQAGEPDVRRMVMLAQERYGSLLDAPWDRIVAAIVAWRPRQRHGPSP